MRKPKGEEDPDRKHEQRVTEMEAEHEHVPPN